MFLRRWLNLLLLSLIVMFFVSCGSAPSSSTGSNTEITSELTLTASTNFMKYNDTLTLNFYLFNNIGDLIKSSKKVTFWLDNPSLAKLSTGSVTTNTGQGSIIITSKTTDGEFNVFASVDNITREYKIKVSKVEPPSSIELSAIPDNITVYGTANIKALVKTATGSPVSDGTVVSFEVDNPAFGSITLSSITVNGIAIATFSAKDQFGKSIITAKSGSAQKSMVLNINPATVASILFDKAEPQQIGLKDSGLVTSSTVTFVVKDVFGNLVTKPTDVKIELFGPNGGEYLVGSTDNKTITVSTVNGVASVVLNSGVVPGTVTLKATISGTNISTSSGVIAIGGGVPNAGRFSLFANRFNYEAFVADGVEDNITVYLADRYGNTNLLANTVVKFFSECGGVSNAAILDAEGKGQVKFRTQLPKPYLTIPTEGSSEYQFLDWFDSIFRTNFKNKTKPEDPNPGDGICTITAVVDGEEAFNDLNGNGKYDLGEPFTDTYDDVYEDADDNYQYSYDSIWRYDELTNSYKLYSEKLIAESSYSKDGKFSGLNGKWDGNKKISKSLRLLMTGKPKIYWIIESMDNSTKFSSSFSKNNNLKFNANENVKLRILIGDENLNAPIKGTIFWVDERLSSQISGPYLFNRSSGDQYIYQDSFTLNYKLFEYTIKISNSTSNSSCLESLNVNVNFKGEDIVETISFYGPCVN